ncbi:MAG: hypothetical protein ACPGVD_09205 [Flavobacteriales bacterium]
MQKSYQYIFLLLLGVFIISNNLKAQDSLLIGKIDSLRIITIEKSIVLENGRRIGTQSYPHVTMNEKYYKDFKYKDIVPKELTIARKINFYIEKNLLYNSFNSDFLGGVSIDGYLATGYGGTTSYRILKNDNGLLSLQISNNFEGPTGGNYHGVALNFDINKAKLLTLEDVIKKDSLLAFNQFFINSAIEKIKRHSSYNPSCEQCLEAEVLDWLNTAEVSNFLGWSYNDWSVEEDELWITFRHNGIVYESTLVFKIEEIKHLLKDEFLMFFD